MRRKSLLVGGDSPFLGPWVHLEEGEWLIDCPRPGDIIQFQVKSNQDSDHTDQGNLRVFGPARVRVKILEGKNVFLSIRQIARA